MWLIATKCRLPCVVFVASNIYPDQTAPPGIRRQTIAPYAEISL